MKMEIRVWDGKMSMGRENEYGIGKLMKVQSLVQCLHQIDPRPSSKTRRQGQS